MSMTPQSLFDHARQERLKKESPLAARMRPQTLEEYIGQRHILAPGRLLRRAIQADRLSSLIFYGPPGTGKTTLASVIANTTKSAFVTLNAVMTGIADLKDVTKQAQRRLGEYGQRTILFIDEVHRWNKAQQDALLPWVENGTIILIGATTENPYFTVNRALVSRSRIFQLKPLDESDIRQVLKQALETPDRGYGRLSVLLEEDALAHLANVANGDARAALNALELAVETTPPDGDGRIVVTLAVAEESIQHRAVLYDREGDYHFDTISAYIKSMRGSDPDAVFYWLAKMVYAGEDPRFIFRRMTIFASEDIGMADPNAVQFVTSCAEAFERVGLPEGLFPLAHAALYCATAPKSNSVLGFFDALKLVEKEREGEVPNHLRDGSRDKEGFGHGVGYKYPHEYRNHWVAQQYLPSALQGRIFYEPGNLGYESTLAEQIRSRRELQLAALREAENGLAPPEILTFSPSNKATEAWLARTVDSLAGFLATIKTELFRHRATQRHERILDLSADSGFLTWEAARRVPEGGVWSLVKTKEARDVLLEQAKNLPELRQPKILLGNLEDLPQLLKKAGEEEGLKFDMIVGRNVLAKCADRTAALKLLKELLEEDGTLALAENLPRRGQRLSLLANATLPKEVRKAEETLYAQPDDPVLGWDADTLEAEAADAGLKGTRTSVIEARRTQLLPKAVLDRWMDDSMPDSYAARLLRAGLSKDNLKLLEDALAPLAGKTVGISSSTAILIYDKTTHE